MDFLIELIKAHSNIVWSILILLGALTAHFTIKGIHSKLSPKIHKTHFVWDSALINAIDTPLLIVIWGATIVGLLHYGLGTHLVINNLGWVKFAFIAIFYWFTLRFIKELELGITTSTRTPRKKYDPTTVHAVSQITRIAISIATILMSLQTFGVSVGAVLAFGGAGGLVVGLAAKDLLSNFFGGLMIYLDRPFVIGDWIRSPDKDIEGVVVQIGWRLTKIRTFDRRPLYIPNGIFSTISLENPSRMTHRRIKDSIGIRYDDATNLRIITQEIREYLRGNKHIDQTLPNIVRFNQYGASSLDILLNAYVTITDWVEFHTAKEEMFCTILDIIEKHGAQIAYPTNRRV